MIQPQRAYTAFYDGTWYRSRLEACWAHFLDIHGIAFEYEKRWFEFGDHTRYQPDFWLPDSQAWLEVKGRLSDEDHHKVLTLARAAQYRGEVVILAGAPAGYLFGEVSPYGDLNLNCAFSRCASCDSWSWAMFGCRSCGFADAERDTYIDHHAAVDRGCSSRCARGSVVVWRDNAPQSSILTSDMDRWSGDSLREFSKFKIISKRLGR